MSYPLPIRWIVFKDHHQVALSDVTPDAVNFSKSSIHIDGRASRKLGLTTARNHVAKLLGSNGSGKAYEQFFETELQPFMKINGLLAPRNLISSEDISAVPSFTSRQVGDRIFKGTPMPSEVFTGWNIPWKTYDNGDAPFWKIVPGGLFLPQTTPPVDGFAKLAATLGDGGDCARFFEAAALETGRYPAAKAKIIGKQFAASFSQERCFDEMIHRVRLYCPDCNSMLGNVFLKFPEETPLQVHCKQYFPSSMADKDIAQAKESEWTVCSIYKQWVKSKKTGWVRVLPFNKNLVFLSDGHGHYDFLIRGARDRRFKHQVFGKTADVSKMPKAHDAYHFERWLHFEYEGWEEKDLDAAEHAFYATGEVKDYPQTSLLRDYLKSVGQYSPPRKTADKLLPGFIPIRLKNGTKLAVSDLVSIGQFRSYLLRNEEALHVGNGKLGAVNPDIYSARFMQSDRAAALTTSGLCCLPDADINPEGVAVPVTATWNDACAYAQWMQNECAIPARLLHCDEYKEIFGSIVPDFAGREELWAAFKGEIKDGAPCTVIDDGSRQQRAAQDFQYFDLANLRSCEKQHLSGIKAITASDFGEWISATHRAINALTHTHLHYIEGSLRCCIAPQSTGKYKGAKIGFRLCYEMTC